MCLPRGCLHGGCLSIGVGVSVHGVCLPGVSIPDYNKEDTPPVNRITDRCKNFVSWQENDLVNPINDRNFKGKIVMLHYYYITTLHYYMLYT